MTDKGHLPTSEVGSGQRPEETPESAATGILRGMETLLTQLLAANLPGTSNVSSVPLLLKFDPDETEANIEGWCKISEVIVTSKKLEGADLLIALTQCLKGRAAICLTQLDVTNLTWERVKELLLAKFARPMQPRDYFDYILRFQIANKETASEAAMRLWNAVERIPCPPMPEDIATGFVISVLCYKDPIIRRELSCQTITSKTQLCRILAGISLKRRADGPDPVNSDVKRFRRNDTAFSGVCHRCGVPGHKQADCNRRREKASNIKSQDKTTPTCYACGRQGHLASTCPTKTSDGAVKEVHVCQHQCARSVLSSSSGETVSFLFDSGSTCSLVKLSLANKFPGTVHHKIIYLTGVGCKTVLCDTQVLTSLTIQGISLSVLLHVVPDNSISEPLIIGRDILELGFHVEISHDTINFSIKEDSNLCEVISNNFDQIDTDLIGEDKIALYKILTKYRECFTDGVPTRRVTTGTMQINLKDPHKIVHRHPYRLSEVEKEIVREKIQLLLDAGVIRESTSPFASPILLVKKSDGSERMCVDYRELNANTLPENYPLPRIEEQIDRLNGAHYFSSIDMASGFHQIYLSPESVEKTAFVTPEGHFEYLTIPFGLRNAPLVFQRCINSALKPVKNVALAYMDDVICFSSNITEGLHRLDTVLKALSDAGFSFNIKKCKFMKKEINYLGYSVKSGQVKPNSRKIKALIDAPVPRTASQVRQFLGLASYFRRFIPQFSKITGPLYPLTKLKGPIQWSEKHAEIHSKIVKILTSEPVLMIYDPNLPIEVHTDACSEGYGAVLVQKINDVPHVVAYFSRRTTDAESRYHSYELETLAVVRAVEHFRHYLYGKHFLVVTDCNSLKASKSKINLTPRIYRWWAILQAYDFDIIYREGRRMEHADFFSRNPLPDGSLTTRDPSTLDSSQTSFKVVSPVSSRKDVNIVDLQSSWLSVEQKRDPEIQDLIQKYHSKELPESISITYDIRNGLLYRNIHRNKRNSWLPVVPRSLIWSLINLVHTEIKHLGYEKTLDKLYDQYWFPQMSKYVRKFVESCIVCQASKGPSGAQQVRLHPIPKINCPWHTIHIDFTGKLSGKSDRKEYASVIIDAFTKYILLEHTIAIDSKAAVNAIKKAVSLFGAPKRIISDQGRCYISAEFKQFCNDHNIELHLIATGSSKANGQVERVMRTLKSLLTIVENDQNKVWRDELSDIQLALNSTKSRVTGYSPTELMFGITSLSLGESSISPHFDSNRLDLDSIRNSASSNIAKNAKSEAQRFNKGKAKVRLFSVGDFVFVKCTERNQTKLARKFKGPFVITKVLENDRYELKSMSESNRVFKYSHENLRAVPRGYDGFVEVSDAILNNVEPVTVDVSNYNQSVDVVSNDDGDGDTMSLCSDTMSAGSSTLSASSSTLDASSDTQSVLSDHDLRLS